MLLELTVTFHRDFTPIYWTDKNNKHLSSQKKQTPWIIINNKFLFFFVARLLPFKRLEIICSRPAKSLVVYWVIDVFVCILEYLYSMEFPGSLNRW